MSWEEAIADIGNDRAEKMTAVELYHELTNRGVDGEQAEDVVKLYQED